MLRRFSISATGRLTISHGASEKATKCGRRAIIVHSLIHFLRLILQIALQAGRYDGVDLCRRREKCGIH